MAEENYFDKLRVETHHSSYNCTANGYIFEKRAERYKWRVTLIKALGIIVPAAVGITVLGYGIENDLLKKMTILAVPVTVIQFLISLWAIIYKWDDELAYAYEAIQSYEPLQKKFHDLANYPPTDFNSLKKEFDVIYKELSFRSQQDTSHSIRNWEKRMGMRYSLREHQTKCVECKDVPRSLKSTKCDVCGKYSFKYRFFNL
jgi:mobilome CxxCx(11)CxxC protein